MADLRFLTGRLLVRIPQTLSRAPAHLDVLSGAARAASCIDAGGYVDRAILRRTEAMRVRRVFGARLKLGRAGDQATAYDDQEHHHGLPDILGVELAEPARVEEVAQELLDTGQVAWARPEPLATVPLRSAHGRSRVFERTEVTWAHDRVRASEALEKEPGLASVRVAVVDTGIALTHPEFRHRIHAGFDTVDLGMGTLASGVRLVGDSRGRDFSPGDGTGHGSHCAGIVSSHGLSIPPGIGGACRLVAVRALAAAFDGRGHLAGVGGTLDIDAALKVAVDLGADVLNMSFGTPEDAVYDAKTPVHEEIMAYATARGTIPVAAMGNSGREERFYPAASPHCIAVGSVGPEGRPSSFSTRGAHVALSAPGENIVSTGLSGYKAATGTSHAAPFVAGTTALLVARAQRHGHRLTTSQALSFLTATAAPAQGGDPKATGAGILDAAAALHSLDAALEEGTV